ncbi:SprT-like family-domain-containing protein [Amylocystis lapponica]|nr:SprT-like family-domain-containing protein [Amylocystis lapponica]
MADSRAARGSRPLHKASSLVLNVSAVVQVPPVQDTKRKPSQDEIIPDSEEERIRLVHGGVMRITHENGMEVIEISSDEDGMVAVERPGTAIHHDVFTDHMPGGWKTVAGGTKRVGSSSESDSVRHQPTPPAPRLKGRQTPRARRIIQSSSSENDEDDKLASLPQLPQPSSLLVPARSTGTTIDLTLDSPGRGSGDRAKSGRGSRGKTSGSASRPALNKRDLTADEETSLPLYADDDSEEEEDPLNAKDRSILTFDEPRSARKPIRHPLPRAGPSTPRRHVPVPVNVSDSDSEDSAAVQTPRASIGTPRRGARAPRLTKKALAAAEQARREAYARALFDELNASVFGGGIPAGTQLVWNKRLLTTAGRAKWHRSRDGVQTTEIELAVKILDCNERIRNTLSHEMCHLACWIINEDPKEGHGNAFHAWASKVMRARPEIHISTKHTYDITYKFEWKCEQCGKIYGRHSKSIRPDECVCGACRVGKLIPLFETAARAPKTPKNKADSQMAAAKSRDSPVIVSSPAVQIGVAASGVRPASIVLEDASDDSDVEFIAQILGGVYIVDGRP